VSTVGIAGAAARCPFLIAVTGDWQLALPSREHRCAAFAPMTSLALDKQVRLCLTPTYTTCATYQASLAASEARTGRAGVPDRVGRWALARTTPLIEDTGGVRTRLIGALSDRRTWPVLPVILLAAVLVALGASGLRDGQPVTALASPTPRTTLAPTSPAGVVLASLEPSVAPSLEPTLAPSTAPSVGPSPTPAFRTTYRVKSGDTLSAIAAKFKTTVSAIVALNGITDSASLKVGQLLKIP
jgi:LysM repeat protein